MSLAADVVTKLAATSVVANKCATNPKTGTKAIRPDRLSQTDKLTGNLCGIEVVVSETDYQTDTIDSGKTAICKLLVDCIALNSTSANALANSVEDSLEPWRGATSGGTVLAVDLTDRREDWGTNSDGSDSGEYVVELELSVIYQRV